MESFGQMPKLRVLSMGRNMLKKVAKLEDVSKTLEELWVSYNQIKTLDDMGALENLEVDSHATPAMLAPAVLSPAALLLGETPESPALATAGFVHRQQPHCRLGRT
jgi:hypothetical protein